ncbi:MAG: endonuclease/exonuclease/phosphatase family protein [Chitinophagales bacterium]|nr:endonuclease/exonuclease/phosphatase family protein [Chitinophagales bacterium]MDW8393967.1 endonuclease/exonuclease/phosphatase family protein [Chitinophagales bacterium]
MKLVKVLVGAGAALLSPVLIASAYAGLIAPEQAWLLAVLGLAFPLLFGATLLLLPALLILNRTMVWLPLSALLISMPTLLLHVRLHATTDAPQPDDIKLVSYNVRNFDLYNWSQEGVVLEQLIQQIRETAPDIICFQEFFNADTGVFRTVSRLRDSCSMPYYAMDKTVERENYGAWGLATFSRYPIVHHQALRFSERTFNSALLCGIRLGKDTLWVLNVHLQSIALEDPDYAYLEQMGQQLDFHLQPTRSIFRKLRYGFHMRPRQAEILQKVIDSLRGPVVLCGDFNDTPGSFVYRMLTRKLSDAFLSAGPAGWGTTYAGIIPLLRIDYVLVNEWLQVVRFQVDRRKLSDHHLISCHLRLRQ